MMGYLQQEKTWLEAHPKPMDTVETTLIEWFCEDRHPDTTNLRYFASSLNFRLSTYLCDNKAELIQYARQYPSHSTWKGDTLPHIAAKIVKPK